MDLDAARRLLETGIRFVQRSGLQVVELRRGYVKCLMPFRDNGNHIGTMYAGALFTLAEIPGGALFLSSFDTVHFFPVVKDLSIRFVKAVKSDATIEIGLAEDRLVEIQAEAEAAGKAEFVLRGEIRDAAGEVVATSTGTYQIRRSR